MKHKKIFENGKFVPQRTCLVCRKTLTKDMLIRISENSGEFTVNGKNGRGAYICKSRECIEKARKIRAIERGLKTNVPSYVYEECLKLGR